ncbi:hypothetical protein D3C75_1372010 [compost metagenome]
MGVGLSGIFVSIIGAGDADISKHEFLFTLCFDLVTFMLAADVIGRKVSAGRKPAASKAGQYPEVQKGVSA